MVSPCFELVLIAALLFTTAMFPVVSQLSQPQTTHQFGQLIQPSPIMDNTAASIDVAGQISNLFKATQISVEFNPQLISDYLKQIDNSGMARVTVAFDFNHELTHQAASGCLDQPCTSRPDERTRYRYGSTTKIFTAVLVMKAVEEGLLTLETTLSTFLPKSKYKIDNSDKMTIKMLLNHRSGLFSYTSDPNFQMYGSSTLDDIVAIVINNQRSQPAPDRVGSYSNTGYYFLGEILQMVYKKSFRDILNEKILSPLSLFSTYLIADEMSSISHSRPDVKRGETLSFVPRLALEWEETPQYTNYSATAAAGAILSTPKDILTFFRGVFIQQRVISASSIKMMREYQKMDSGLNYGLGIFQIHISGPNGELHEGFGHDGGLDGFQSFSAIFASKPGAEVLTDGYLGYSQSANAFNSPGTLGIGVHFMQYMTGVQLTIPPTPNASDPNIDKYDSFVGRYHPISTPRAEVELATQPPNVTVHKRQFTRELYNHKTKSFETQTLPVLTLFPQGQTEYPFVYNPQLPPASYAFDNVGAVMRFDPNHKDTIFYSQAGFDIVYKR